MLSRRPYKCTFVLSRKHPDEDPRLVCRVRWNASRSIVDTSVGFTVNPDKWDSDAQLCAPRTFHGKRKVPAATINAEIGRYRDCVDTLFTSYLEKAQAPSVDQLRHDLRVSLGLEPSDRAPVVPSVAAALSAYLVEGCRERAWSDDTLKALRSFTKRVRESEVFSDWEDFSLAGLKRFTVYMQDDLGMSDTTVHKRLGYLRGFCQWATEKGYLTDGTWKKYRPKLKTPRKEVVFLSWDEFERVWGFQTTDERLSNARDIFCLCSTTALRYGDAMALTWADVTDTSLRVMTHKSLDPTVIELNDYSAEIIRRCRERRRPDSIYVLPHYCNQPLNRAIKDLMRAVGLTDLVRVTRYYKGQRVDEILPKCDIITCHVGRKTFICHALEEGIPPTVVMEWTGHTDYKAMLPYIAVAGTAKAQAMASAFRKK